MPAPAARPLLTLLVPFALGAAAAGQSATPLVVEGDVVSGVGAVTSIHMVKDPKSGRFKGSAFVRMATPAEARDVLNSLDGTYLVDRCIKITAARPKQAESPAMQPHAGQTACTPRRRR